MKKIFALGLWTVVTSVISIVLYAYSTGDPFYPEGVIQTKLFSRILGQEREIIIHLPRNPDSTKKYPVVYVLDGTSQDGHIANKFEILSTAGYAPKTIIVGIPNMTAENRQRQLIPPYMRIDAEKTDSPFGEADTFLSFIESELFSFIENNYPASQVRLFMGNSRSGLLVMHSLLYKPEMFQARFCYSTPLWREANIIVSKVADLLRSSDTLATFLYMSAGEKETENIKNGLAAMAKALKEKTPQGLGWHADYTPNGNHQNNAQISATTGIVKWAEYLKR